MSVLFKKGYFKIAVNIASRVFFDGGDYQKEWKAIVRDFREDEDKIAKIYI